MAGREKWAHRQVLEEVAPDWDIDPASVRLVRDGMNHVFEATSSGTPVIVRVTDDAHRCRDLVLGELQWTVFLEGRGCRVTHALPSLRGSYVESRRAGGRLYHVACFRKEQGQVVRPGDPAWWNEDLFRAWGRAIGRLHRESAAFRFQPPGRRQHWYEEPELAGLDSPDPCFPADVVAAMRSHLERLRALPQGEACGLVHNDVKDDNFFVVGPGELLLFDFDESCLCWLLNDLVVPLYFYYAYPLCQLPGAGPAEAGRFLAGLLEGYRQEHPLTREQLERTQDLLKLREILIYVIIRPHLDYWQRSAGARSLTHSFPETVALMEERMRRGAPVIELDFSSF